MDEVDGMSAGDRGGVADLIQVGGKQWGAEVLRMWRLAGAARHTIVVSRRPLPRLVTHCTLHTAHTQTIHKTKVPIICICNDKYNMKLKSLRNHTLELDYRK